MAVPGHGHLLFIPFALILLMPSTSSICEVAEAASAAAEVEQEYETISMVCNKVHARDGRNFTNSFEGIAAEFGLAETAVAGFNYLEAGIAPDKVYALAECWVKHIPQDCGTCIKQAVNLVRGCLPKTGGRVILDGCFIRVDNYSFGNETTSSSDTARCGIAFNNASEFAAATTWVLNVLEQETPFATNKLYSHKDERNSTTVQGVAKCWHTINQNDCSSCVDDAAYTASACLPATEARILNAGCFLRYSDYQLLDHIPTVPRSVPGGPVFRVYYGLGAALVIILAICIGFFGIRVIYARRQASPTAMAMDISLLRSGLQFKYATLQKATDNFSETNKLGQGGYGEVYKGVLQDGREIAIKRLFLSGGSRGLDVFNELDILSRAQHKSLVRFLGCCFTNEDHLLIYEFVPNRSLDLILFDPEKKKELDWEKRFRIIEGTAEGLEYLHKYCPVRVIHRDIKASNILLDLRYRPKISDFGVARFFAHGNTIISNTVVGTLGYMAPEYLARGRLTEKVDIYGFGVLILEIVSGMANNDFEPVESMDTLVTIAWKHFQCNTVSDIIDKSLDKYDVEDIKRVIQVGLLCTQESPTLRPSMTMVIKILKEKEMELPIPSKPAFTEELMTISFLESQNSHSSSSCLFYDIDH